MGRNSDAKEKLLQVGFDLIWNQSYGAVSVDQICAQAGVNKGSFYHYFPSKADLVVAAYEEDWREKQPELDRIFSPQAPPLERIGRWCDYVQRRQKIRAEKHGHVCGCPYGSLGAELATQDEKIRAKIQELVERNLRYLTSTIADAQREGLLVGVDPRSLATWIYSTTLGFTLHAKIRNNLAVLRELRPAVLSLMGAPAATLG
ncbi:MAG TPA: TetR/AcrR family transcriptional regulator [Verrucomicrobiota bacterium]|nr:TetR/AcrR family transcriptional regulator [Verrucomicrobiota bacterium]HNT15881.1 TetR/AcrR family transcriptional regulator [Verrucomicrobiota bacterium]